MTQVASLAELRPELEQIAAAAGCELVHVELKGGVLRLILDKPEGPGEPGSEAPEAPDAAGPRGVTLADCQHVSKQVSAFLDVADFGKGRYVLEVSSPGLDRQLYKPADVERFAGRLARVAVTDPESGARRTVVGRLQELQRGDGPEGDARVVLRDDKSGETTAIRWKDIRVARLEIEL